MSLTGDGATTAERLPVRAEFDFETSAREHYPVVLAYLRARTRNPELAQDLAQDTFLQAYRSRHAFNPARGTERDWFIGIARNVSASAARRQGPLPQVDAILDAAWTDSGAAPLQDARIAALERCLENLASKTREILRMVYDTGLTYAEISARLGLGLSAVKVAACRARQMLTACVRRACPERSRGGIKS